MLKRLCLLLALTSTLVAPLWSASPKSWLALDGASGETPDVYKWSGGSGTLQVWGAFTGGPTVALEWTSFSSAPFLEIDSTACTLTTADTFCNFSIGNGDLRLVITGGSGVGIVSARIGSTNQASTGGAGAGGGGSAVTLDWDQDGTFNVFEGTTDVTAFDYNDDGAIDLEILEITALVDYLGSTGAQFQIGYTDLGVDKPGIQLALSGALFFTANTGAGPVVGRLGTTATIPAFEPHVNAPGWGLGLDLGNPSLNLTVASVSRIQLDTSEVIIQGGVTFGLPPNASPPTACSGTISGHVYWDTNQLLVCRCDGTLWEGMNVGGGGAITCT